VHALDAAYPAGGHYHLGSRTLPVPDGPAVEALLAAAEALPPGGSALNVHHVHGAATRVPLDATAYSYRGEHLVVELLGCWTDGTGTAERLWVDLAEHLLDPHALPGGWINLMAAGDPRAQDAFGPNTARLLATKKRYDAHGVFSGAPIPG
jgi:hypothetical protein